MDETIATKQGTPPVTGQSSSGNEGSTSQQTETYTKDQVEKQISDALAKAGRDAKSFTDRESTLKATEAALKSEKESIAKWQADRDREEFETLKDDPSALTKFQRNKEREKALHEAETKLADDRVLFEKEKAAHTEKLTAAEETEREILIWELAGEKIDPEKLKGFCDKFNARTKEEIQVIVNTISSEVKPELKVKPDSSATIGGGGKSYEVGLLERYPTMK